MSEIPVGPIVTFWGVTHSTMENNPSCHNKSLITVWSFRKLNKVVFKGDSTLWVWMLFSSLNVTECVFYKIKLGWYTYFLK